MSHLIRTLLVGVLLLPALVRAETPKPEFFDRAFSSQEAMESLTTEERAELEAYLSAVPFESTEGDVIAVDSVFSNLDRESYDSGDTATVLLSISSEAMTSHAIAHADTNDVSRFTATLSLLSGDGSVCAGPKSEDFPVSDTAPIFTLPVSASCGRPAVSVALSDTFGRSLGEWTISTSGILPESFLQKEEPVPTAPVSEVESPSFPIRTVAIAIVAVLFLVAAGVITLRIILKGKAGILVWFLLLSGTLSAGTVSAESLPHFYDELPWMVSVNGRPSGLITTHGKEKIIEKGDEIFISVPEITPKERWRSTNTFMSDAAFSAFVRDDFPETVRSNVAFLLDDGSICHQNYGLSWECDNKYTPTDEKKEVFLLEEPDIRYVILGEKGPVSCVVEENGIRCKINDAGPFDLSFAVEGKVYVRRYIPERAEMLAESYLEERYSPYRSVLRRAYTEKYGKEPSGRFSQWIYRVAPNWRLDDRDGMLSRIEYDIPRYRNFGFFRSPSLLEFWALPTSVASGSASKLSWSTKNLTSCTASNGWSGSKSVSGGSESTGPLTSAKTYTLTCKGSGGSVSRTATVSVMAVPAPAPTLSFYASPTSVSQGNASTLYWTSTNATSCTASGGWSGTKATSGFLGVTPSSTTTYTLTCTGPGGTTVPQDVTISVSAPLSSLKICVGDCTSGARYDTGGGMKSFSNIPITLHACFGTGNCTTGDASVSGTWTAGDTPGNAVDIGTTSGSSTYVTKNPALSGSVSEDITVTYDGKTATARALVSGCIPASCTDEEKAEHCFGEEFTKPDGCGGGTTECAGTRSCDMNWKEVVPGL